MKKIYYHLAGFSILLIFTVFVLNCGTIGQKPFFRQIDVFVSGTEGYHTFRIPSVIVAPNGTVLAFCEGRKTSRSDTGDIDIVLKKSFDNGITWQPMKVVWDDGENVCGNPCPVVDSETGIIWLLLTHNLGQDHEKEIIAGTSEGTRTVWVMNSTDNGDTWSEPVEITESTRMPGWAWYATGPGVGIRLLGGRLVIPCDFITIKGEDWGSHVIYSDDHGATWKLGGTVLPQTNESQAVELSDGTLLLNMRNYSGNHLRAVTTSSDSGMIWSDIRYDETLIEPVCQASIIRYPGKNIILFSNPASKDNRIKMTVRLSDDDCKTWKTAKLIFEGPSAYSCLTVLPDSNIGCLYERGNEHPYETISFAVFDLEWLNN